VRINGFQDHRNRPLCQPSANDPTVTFYASLSPDSIRLLGEVAESG
ncbi:uncharacterized protein METZ01_LOCUS241687, partial [marine metagenome]